jgi:hypothetical protein
MRLFGKTKKVLYDTNENRYSLGIKKIKHATHKLIHHFFAWSCGNNIDFL